jgi:hypothetical protein
VLNDAAPPGKELEYARPERERRFLFTAPPDGPVIRTVRIVDRYLLGTRIRLRQATEASGDGDAQRTIHKLTQKVSASDGGLALITTMYLEATEYAALLQLPAATLRKTRLSIPPLGVDVFEGELFGLVLGEAEFEDDASMTAFPLPRDAVADVTRDRRLSGGRLVVTSAAELAAVLHTHGIDPRTSR